MEEEEDVPEIQPGPLLSLPQELLALTASKVQDKAALRLTCHATLLAVNHVCTQLVWCAERRRDAVSLSLAAVLPALCPNIKLLDCSRMGRTSVSLVGCPSTVQTLICHGAGVADLSPLTACTGLQTLRCSGTQVADLGPQASCLGLQTLYCSSNQVADLVPLAACKGLQFLSCGGTQVADLGPLAACTGLQTLSCDHCVSAAQVQQLQAACSKLEVP